MELRAYNEADLQRAYQELSTTLKGCFPGLVATESVGDSDEVRRRKTSVTNDSLPVEFEVEREFTPDVLSYDLSLTLWIKAERE